MSASLIWMAGCGPGIPSPELSAAGGAGAVAGSSELRRRGTGGSSNATGGAAPASTGGETSSSSGGSVGTGGSPGTGGRATGGSASGGNARTGGNPGSGTGGGGGTMATGGSGGRGTGGGGLATGGNPGGRGGRAATGGNAASVGGSNAATTGGNTGAGGSVSPPADGGTPASDAGSASDAGNPVVAWRPFSASSAWNTPIAASPAIDPSSGALVDDLVHGFPGQDFLWINLADFSVPVYYVDGTTPIRTVATDLAGEGFDGKVPIPAGALPDPESDHHFAIVDRTRNLTWSMWDASISSSAAHCTVGARADLLGAGVHPLADVANPWQAAHDARACGFPLIAGLIRVDEIRAGRIPHALVIAYPHIRSRYYLPPASTAQGTTGSDAAQPNRGIPCGGRVQLDPSIDVTKLGLSPSAVIIARALQEYGAYVGDYSGSISIYAENAPGALAQWNTGLLDSNDLGKLDLTRLRVLTIGALHDNGN